MRSNLLLDFRVFFPRLVEHLESLGWLRLSFDQLEAVVLDSRFDRDGGLLGGLALRRGRGLHHIREVLKIEGSNNLRMTEVSRGQVQGRMDEG